MTPQPKTRSNARQVAPAAALARLKLRKAEMKAHDPNSRQPSRMKGSGRHYPNHGSQKPKEKK